MATISDEDGYHRLATLMTRDQSIAIFRRFDFANILGLLSLQAEIIELQEDFRVQCYRDKMSGNQDREMYSCWFQKLREADQGKADQYLKLKTLREKMTFSFKVNLLDAPDSTQLAALRDWLMDKQGGAHFLKDSEARLWETEDGSSLVRVGNSKGEHDVFTRFTSWFVVSLLHRYSCLPKSTGRVVDVETGMVSYDESKIIRAGTITATVLSSMFPVLSILVLYVVKNTYARIGIAAGFTALFAVFLASFSSARRVEIFAATATFAAVEVVFIGSALNPSA